MSPEGLDVVHQELGNWEAVKSPGAVSVVQRNGGEVPGQCAPDATGDCTVSAYLNISASPKDCE